MYEEEFPSAPLEPKGSGDSLKPHEPRHHSPRFDDPVSWSVAVLRLGSITVRLHAVMLATILVLLLRSAWFQGESGGVLGPGFSLVMVVLFFWVPLMEEMVLLWSIRRLGGAASEVVLHPLGGLDVSVFPPGWRRHGLAAASGLVALALLAIVVGALLGFTTGSFQEIAPPNPLSLEGLYSIHMMGSWWLSALFLLEWVCVLVLVANLVPAPPMRGWHVLHALLRSRLGWSRSHRLVLRIAVVSIVGLVVLGLLIREITPILVALLCTMCLREEYQRLRALHSTLGHELQEHSMLHADSLIEQEEAASSEAIRRVRRMREDTLRKEEEDALDRILLKISRQGRHSLDRGERRVLKRATRRRRSNQDD